MEIIRMTGTEDIRYPEFASLYKTSFPVFEQRTEEQQQIAFRQNNYHLDLYYEEDTFIGFLGYWEFDTYIYIKHFAIHSTLRGKGQGSRILESFIAGQEKIILLEIDPLVDEVSEARFRFYQKCGFYRNDHTHTHPPYRDGYQAHPLLVLTTQRKITGQEYKEFGKDLEQVIMKK
ncbi:MAG: GNAT family N-acetyltransferase [Bacteroides sp.]|nr:GNAT family N-acetyltransferase [Bacteroides sp.]